VISFGTGFGTGCDLLLEGVWTGFGGVAFFLIVIWGDFRGLL